MDNVHKILRDVRIVPVVLVAIGALLTLKLTGLFTGTGYVLVGGPAAEQRERQAQDRAAMQQAAAKKPKEPERKADGQSVQLADPKPVSAAERALLERLSERRQELEQRAREIEMRETLMQAAEQKLQAKTNELKDIEARIVTATQKKEESEQARMKSLVTMYENMKAKDAAKIFDRLDIRLATQVANMINPRRMSDILAQMSPETAERLTVELAKVGVTAEKPMTPDLPKIEGRPPGT
jgi:flagellar motility protein MotE (MotC chaperone)